MKWSSLLGWPKKPLVCTLSVNWKIKERGGTEMKSKSSYTFKIKIQTTKIGKLIWRGGEVSTVLGTLYGKRKIQYNTILLMMLALKSRDKGGHFTKAKHGWKLDLPAFTRFSAGSWFLAPHVQLLRKSCFFQWGKKQRKHVRCLRGAFDGTWEFCSPYVWYHANNFVPRKIRSAS